MKAQPLNYAPKAIEQFRGFAGTATDLSRPGFAYLADKLAQAQVFVLPDYGELLERSKQRPEVPGLLFKPPFPVVALEFQAPPGDARSTPGYTDAPCSRRIALAWEWQDDLPDPLCRMGPGNLGDGVVVASIVYSDHHDTWIPMAGAAHLAFDEEWSRLKGGPTPFVAAAIASGRLKHSHLDAPAYPTTLLPLLPEVLFAVGQEQGHEAMTEGLMADLMDEVNAYLDLCYALGCGNVATEKHLAPSKLNAARLKAGKVPLFDFHVLTLAGADGRGEAFDSDREGPRSHLRRGHIRHLRHLGPDRITWVNASMVRGRGGFVDKAYRMERAA